MFVDTHLSSNTHFSPNTYSSTHASANTYGGTHASASHGCGVR